MPSNTAIAVIGGKPVTLEVLLERSREEIAKALPMQLPVERLIRTAITTVRKSEKLQNCDALSIVGCVMEGAAIGLEIGTALGNAYMVPYGGEAQFQIGYRGLTTLAYRGDRVSWCDGKVVYGGDEFDYRHGTDPYINHVPCGESDFDKVTHAYFIVKLTDGAAIFNVWPVEKILAHRDKYSKAYQKSKTDNPWTLAPEAMYIKTVARPTLKMAPISTELQRAISLDEQAEVGIPQQLAKDLAGSISGDGETKGDPTTSPEVVEHNRDEYPSRGKHAEQGKEPLTYRDLTADYLEVYSERLQPCEMKDRLIAEIKARRDEAPAETTAEFEDMPSPKNELLKLLECPAVPQQYVEDLTKEADDKRHGKAWFDQQIAIVKGLIADAEKEA